jgi:hypothetical protein
MNKEDMLGSLYVAYYEAKACCCDGQIYEDGGFLYAADFQDAMAQIERYYKEDLISCTIELLEEGALVLPLAKAKEMRKMLD